MEKGKPVRVLVALGSNLGRRDERILAAWQRVNEIPSIKTLRISRLIPTKPVGGPPGQPDFLNAAGLLETTLDPSELLDILQSVEKEGWRERHQFWGPRTIDLDIILYGNKIIQTPRLTIPHRRLAWRPFVLIPACDVAPDMIHPVFHLTIRQLLNLAQMNFRLAAMGIAKLPPCQRS